ncbi:hypothetical protein M8J76_015120 [Diaphorina citri]|nr:hypothetical protein M8J76_015120 [Diaphorina citri]KAI5734331.1 hypothetical protein M8J77_005167 [Diaphorina citri]
MNGTSTVPSTTHATSNVTEIPILTTVPPDVIKPRDTTVYLVALVSAISFLILFVSVMLFYLRKKRLDKLRHQLMPFYSFDPHEEDGDWESDLLDDNMPVSGKRIDYKSVEFAKAGVVQSRRL